MSPFQQRLLAVLAGVGIGLLVVLRAMGDPSTIEPQGPFVDFALEDALKVTIERPEDTVELEKVSGVWKMTAPIEADADPDFVRDLLASARHARRFEEVDVDVSPEFGLAPAKAKLSITLEEGERYYEVGSQTPGMRKTYLGHEGRVYASNSDLFETATLRAQEFREHRIFSVDPGEITRVRVTSPDGVLEASRKEQGLWYTTGYGRASTDAVDDWVTDLLRLRVDLFLDLDHTSIEHPLYEAELETTNGLHRLEVGRSTPYGQLVLFGGTLDGVVAPPLLAMFERGPTAIAAGQVFPFQDGVERVVRTDGVVSKTFEKGSSGFRALETATPVYRDASDEMLPPAEAKPVRWTFELFGSGRSYVFDVSEPDRSGRVLVTDRNGGGPVRVDAEFLKEALAD